MNAHDSTPPSGESLSGESFPQHCINCKADWRLLGELEATERKCPECGCEACSSRFFRWWILEHLDTTPRVEVEVPREVSAAIDALEPVVKHSRQELLRDLVMPQVEFEEEQL